MLKKNGRQIQPSQDLYRRAASNATIDPATCAEGNAAPCTRPKRSINSIPDVNAPPESGKCRADFHSPLGPHGLLQDHPDLCLSAPTVLGRSHAKRAMCLLRQIANSDDSHCDSVYDNDFNDSILCSLTAITGGMLRRPQGRLSLNQLRAVAATTATHAVVIEHDGVVHVPAERQVARQLNRLNANYARATAAAT